MIYQILKIPIFFFIITSCETGKLTVIANLPNSLKEASAIETVKHSDLLWTIEDAGNKNEIYGLNEKGAMVKTITIENTKNDDWEDLTADDAGNLYIGDFGNNNKKRDKFTIYKVSEFTNDETTAEIINFTLPKSMKSEDFESFFILKNAFYIFSKTNKKHKYIKVPNLAGTHVAELVSDFKLNGKNLKITSADISEDGKTIVLLNHDKLWKITDFKLDDFLSGTVEVLTFNHTSQKEGICFMYEHTVYISDERKKNEGGKVYSFNLN